MPYPNSPFQENFDLKVFCNLKIDDDHKSQIQNNIGKFLQWLCTFPKITTFRVNTLKTSREAVLKKIHDHISKIGTRNVIVEYSDIFTEVIVIKHQIFELEDLQKYEHEVIIDTECAAAILRGAHIYAPGVLGMLSGTRLGDHVSIYADENKKCKKGLSKIFTEGSKIFVGNGIAKMTRHDLFGENIKISGIAIETTESLSGCPPMGDNFLPVGWALLQNLASIVCVYNLNPQQYDEILDMCAAPGNKTTHIAALMENTGTLIAIDKTPKKIEHLSKTCMEFGARVKIFQADSTKIRHINSNECSPNLINGPPFLDQSFDKILLDAPCSALGKRPQLANKTSEKVIKSYVPLQRKLFETAVHLLKTEGTLVYSTCTITLAENEGIVAWALKKFPCLTLIKPSLYLGGPGWYGTTLSDEDRLKVQRFGPDQELDSVGFFIACFNKV